jgi:hypothetical protein
MPYWPQFCLGPVHQATFKNARKRPLATGGIKDDTGNNVVDLGTGGFTYLLAKYDGPSGGSEIWNVQGLTGGYTIPLTWENGQGLGLSHWTLFGGGGQVPDGGTTVMLLGAALGGLGMALFLPLRQKQSGAYIRSRLTTHVRRVAFLDVHFIRPALLPRFRPRPTSNAPESESVTLLDMPRLTARITLASRRCLTGSRAIQTFPVSVRCLPSLRTGGLCKSRNNSLGRESAAPELCAAPNRRNSH